MRTAEQHFALREGHHNAAAEAYFDARPELDLPLGRKTFEAGFVRAFDLLAAARNGAMHSLSGPEWQLLALVASQPGIADALIDRASFTPYEHLEGYMRRWWLFNRFDQGDDPPEGLARAVAATVQHLGLCCLGDRVVRLTLPNGRVIRVTLE